MNLLLAALWFAVLSIACLSLGIGLDSGLLIMLGFVFLIPSLAISISERTRR